jgi:hypothetical protein
VHHPHCPRYAGAASSALYIHDGWDEDPFSNSELSCQRKGNDDQNQVQEEGETHARVESQARSRAVPGTGRRRQELECDTEGVSTAWS